MTTVSNRITTAAGVATPGWVLARLVGPSFRSASQTEAIAEHQVQTAPDGSWSLELEPNTVEAPYYVIAEQAVDFRTVQHVVAVPDVDAAWLGDITVQVPLPLGSALAVYAGVPGPVGKQGPPYTGSQQEFTTAVSDVVAGDASAETSTLRDILGGFFVRLLPTPRGGGQNDAARLTAAFDAAPAGAVLYAPRGAAYVVSTLSLNKRLTLDFTGATVTQLAAQAANLLNIGTGAGGSTVRGGTWDGNNTAQTATNNRGIVVGTNVNGVTVEGLTVQNTRHAGVYGAGANDLRVRRVRVINSGYIGIFSESNAAPYDGVEVSDCFVDRSMLPAATISEGGIKIKGNSAVNVLNNGQVLRCLVRMPASPTDGSSIAIETTYAPKCQVLGNRTFGGTMGISVAACDRSNTQGNTITAPSGYAIELAGSRWSTCIGNTIDGQGLPNTGVICSTGNSVYSDGSVISGNTITGVTGALVRVQAAKQVSVSDNTLLGSNGGYIVNATQADGLTVDGNVIDGLGTATKAVVLEVMSRASITGNTIRNCTQHGVLMLAGQAAYVISLIAITGNVFESVNGQVGTQVSNGASVGSDIKVSGNSGCPDYFDFATQRTITFGTAAPEGVAFAGYGSLYVRTQAGANDVFVKRGALNTNTGWAQLAAEGRAVTGKLLTTGGIGVGNSVAATTPGTVTRKIEVFDAAGASLGFAALYGSIT